jgi:hypothetical protein
VGPPRASPASPLSVLHPAISERRPLLQLLHLLQLACPHLQAIPEDYRFTSIGTGGSNWLKTLIPDAAGGNVASGAVAAGNEGVTATQEPFDGEDQHL